MAETVEYGECECCGASSSNACARRCESTTIPDTLYATFTNVRTVPFGGDPDTDGTPCPDLEGVVVELNWQMIGEGFDCFWGGETHIDTCEGDTGATISVRVSGRINDDFDISAVGSDVVGDAWPGESSAMTYSFIGPCSPYGGTAADAVIAHITDGQHIMGMPYAPCCPTTDPQGYTLVSDVVISE